MKNKSNLYSYNHKWSQSRCCSNENEKIQRYCYEWDKLYNYLIFIRFDRLIVFVRMISLSTKQCYYHWPAPFCISEGEKKQIRSRLSIQLGMHCFGMAMVTSRAMSEWSPPWDSVGDGASTWVDRAAPSFSGCIYISTFRSYTTWTLNKQLEM